MKKFKIVPKKGVIPGVVISSSAEDAIVDFATSMDTDMSLYLEAVEITDEEFEEIKDQAVDRIPSLLELGRMGGIDDGK